MPEVRRVPLPDVVRNAAGPDVTFRPHPDVVHRRDFATAVDAVPEQKRALFAYMPAAAVPDLTWVLYTAIAPEEFPLPVEPEFATFDSTVIRFDRTDRTFDEAA